MKYIADCKTALKLLALIMGSLVLIKNAHSKINEKTVEIIVKNSNCLPGKTIEDALKDKINTHTQRDLGWRVFNEDGKFEVERAFLMNKSMQLRFRWRVNQDGIVQPVGSRAESLCSPDSNE